MDLSRRDAFRPCSRDSSGDKGQFCCISQKKLLESAPLLYWNLIGILFFWNLIINLLNFIGIGRTYIYTYTYATKHTLKLEQKTLQYIS